MDQKNKYIPGICNIGKDELKVRRKNALVMGFISLALTSILLFVDVSKFWRFLLFVPVTAFVVGVQQWRQRFCVYFGMKGLFNFGPTETTDTVEQAEMRKMDQAKAIKMISIAVIVGLIYSVLFFMMA